MSHYTEGCYEVYRETPTKARKAKPCSACGLTIGAGDVYMRVRWVFDGSARGVERCGACQQTHEHLRGVIDRNGLSGEMWPDELLNCGLSYVSEWEQDPPDEIARLPFLAAEERSSLLSARRAVRLDAAKEARRHAARALKGQTT